MVTIITPTPTGEQKKVEQKESKSPIEQLKQKVEELTKKK